jgi:hypothetical protein
MTTILRIALLVVGVLFFTIGTGFLLAPMRLGEALGVAANGAQGLSTIRGDFTSFFWVGGISMALGGLRNHAELLLVAASLVGVTLTGRIISLLVDGTYPGAFQPMLIEAFALTLALVGARVLGKGPAAG